MNARRIHRWLALGASPFFFAWLVSGLAMLSPRLPAELAKPPEPEADFIEPDDLTVTAGQALATAARENGTASRAKEIVARRFRDRIVYDVRLDGGERLLIDARSGETLRIDAGLAETIARHSVGSEGHVARTTRLEERDFFYWGPLPVWRVEIDDSRGTTVYVATDTGQVHVTNRTKRIRAAIAGLHEFEPLRLVTENGLVRRIALFGVALFSLGAVLTGWRLALPARSRDRRREGGA